jgi:VWFA-related protein
MSRSLLTLLLVLTSAALGTAQGPSTPQAGTQQPAVTFRSEVNFVEVPAIVTDASGAFVRGLTADDFEIYEDGRPQKTATFALIDLPIERAPAPGPGGEVVEPDVRAATRTFAGSLYIFLLDDLHTDFRRSNQVREAARKFIQQYLGTNDLAAVVYTSGRQEAGQELTGNRRLLLAAIDRFQGRKLPSAGLERLAVHLRDVDNQVSLGDATQPVRSQEGLQRARDVADPLDLERASNARRALQAIQGVASWTTDIQGRRKALLYFSEGLDYDVYDPFNSSSSSMLVRETQEAMSAAQHANINIYPIDPRGLSQFSGLVDINARSDYPQLEYGNFRGALRELLLSQESLISLANETGGLAVVNAGDVVGGLGRVVLDNSRYYLLGYYSDAKRWSDKFLKFDVRVKRPGLRVRARSGFLPPNSRAMAKAREAETKAGTSPALRAALSKPVPVGELPFRVFAAALRGPGALASVVVAIEIDGSALKFRDRNGRSNETVEVSIVAADERAKVQGTDRQSFEMNLLPQTRERVSQTGVRLLSRLAMPPGRYQIRVGVHESSGSTLGTVPYDIEVDDFSKPSLALSGVLLSSSRADAFANANPDPELQGLLSSAPVVSRTFSRDDTLTWFVEAYENSSQSSRSILFETTVQGVQDGRTVFRARDERSIQPGDKTRGQGFSTRFPLKDLSPGQYVLRVDARATSSGQSVHRDVPFEVR